MCACDRSKGIVCGFHLSRCANFPYCEQRKDEFKSDHLCPGCRSVLTYDTFKTIYGLIK